MFLVTQERKPKKAEKFEEENIISIDTKQKIAAFKAQITWEKMQYSLRWKMWLDTNLKTSNKGGMHYWMRSYLKPEADEVAAAPQVMVQQPPVQMMQQAQQQMMQPQPDKF